MNKNYIIGIVVITFALLVGAIWSNSQESSSPPVTESNQGVEQKLYPEDEITHGHGLAVDVSDSNKVYIATHHGLLVLVNEKDLFRVGTSRDDYMGFSVHSTSPSIFFSSGHPATGGNVGFQKSEDGGITWKKISNGLNGPVDFHAMAVSPVNPNLLDGFVAAIAIHPTYSQTLLISSEVLGLAKSSDSGKNWQKIEANFNGESPLFIAYDKQKSETVYILTEKNSMFKSTDSGES